MIRPAETRDIERLTDLVMTFMDDVELENAGLVPDRDTIEFFCQDCIESDSHIVLVAEEGGIVIGAIAGAVTRWTFNYDTLLLQEIGWFIPHEYRNRYPKAAMSLRKQFHKRGKELGATVLAMISTKREESPRVMQMYEKTGLTRIESTFFGRL